ncbi:putative beta-galactosidase [Helianthus annuus]|nr:putative beta-galactosidase [Helianthus annuus]
MSVGLPRFPKWGHLKELHRAIKLCEHALLNNKPALVLLGPKQEADVYEDQTGTCAAFIANLDDTNEKTVQFRNASYTLPAWSVSILPDCKNVVFNTAKVGSQTSTIEMVPEKLQPNWEIYVEKSGIWGEADFTRNGFVDHINTTKDTTDYLWHTTRFFVDRSEDFLTKGIKPTLLIESKGHALHAFVNGILQGSSASGNGTVSPFKFKSPVSLKAGNNEIAILSMTVGLQVSYSFFFLFYSLFLGNMNGNGSRLIERRIVFEWVGAGLTSVKLEG